jgi:hypothetical protein
MFRAFDRLGPSLAVLASLAALATTGSASAQENPSLDPVFQCQELQNDAERLACFDAAVSSLRAESNEIVVIRRSEVEAVERDSFGLELPSLPRLSLSLFSTRDNQLETGSGQSGSAQASGSTDQGARTAQAAPSEQSGVEVLRREDDGQINEISLPIDRVERRGFDTIHIHTTNGQVWEITDRVGNRPIRVRDDSVMVVRRASLGSYLMQIDGRDRSYRVQRIR